MVTHSYLFPDDILLQRADYNNEWLHGFDWNQRRRGQYVRDQFIRDSQLAMNGHGSRGNHVHLYLNGVYWGLYNPSERPDAAFGATYFGGEHEDWDAMSHRGVRDGNGVAWNTLNTRANADLSIQKNYEAVIEYINLPQYIDYMIVNLWAGMQDWPFNNWNAIRRREVGNGFMFFCWDSERSMEGLTTNRTSVNQDAARFYHGMRANPEFRLAFADRVHKHFFNEGALTPAQTIARYQAAAASVETAGIRARAYASGEWSALSDGSWLDDLPEPGIIHQWDFENAATFLAPSQTVGGGAALAVVPGPFTEVVRNTTAQGFDTAHLRVNNPLDSTLIWSLPTTGFGGITLTMSPSPASCCPAATRPPAWHSSPSRQASPAVPRLRPSSSACSMPTASPLFPTTDL